MRSGTSKIEKRVEIDNGASKIHGPDRPPIVFGRLYCGYDWYMTHCTGLSSAGTAASQDNDRPADELLGFVLFGYDQGVMSGIITAPAFNDLFTATKNNSTMQGFVTAIYEIGTY